MFLLEIKEKKEPVILDFCHQDQYIFDKIEKSEYIAICVGEIFNERAKISNPATYLTQKMILDSNTTPLEIQGHFLFVFYDKITHRIEIINDLFSFYPVYMYTNDNRILLSTNIYEIVSKLQHFELNFDAILTFMKFGHLFSKQTFIRDIERVPPATRLQISWTQTIKIKNNRYFTYAFQNNEISQKEQLQVLKNSWRSAVKRRMPKEEKIVCLLSGGMDSRQILASLKSFRPQNLSTYTMLHENMDQTEQIVRKIGETAKIANQHFFSIDPTQLLDKFQEIYRVHHPFFMIYKLTIVDPYFDQLKNHVVFDGFLIDAILGGTYLSDRQIEKEPSLINLILHQGQIEAKYQKFIKMSSFSQKIEKIVASQLNCINNIMNLDKTAMNPVEKAIDSYDKVMIFNILNRGASGISSGPFFLSTVIPVRCPLIDTALMKAIFNGNALFYKDRKMQRQIFSEISPELFKIKFNSVTNHNSKIMRLVGKMIEKLKKYFKFWRNILYKYKLVKNPATSEDHNFSYLIGKNKDLTRKIKNIVYKPNKFEEELFHTSIIKEFFQELKTGKKRTNYDFFSYYLPIKFFLITLEDTVKNPK